MRVHCVALRADEITYRQDIACTSPLRTAWDTAVWLELAPAVVIVDGMLASGLVTSDELALIVKAGGAMRARGVRRVRRVVELADAGASSPAESRIRVRLVLAGLPRPVTQYEIRVPGLALHADLAWPRYKVALEYDGEYHRHAHAHALHLDRRGLNLLAGAGWIVLHATSERSRRDFRALVTEVETALRGRGWRPEGRLKTT